MEMTSDRTKIWDRKFFLPIFFFFLNKTSKYKKTNFKLNLSSGMNFSCFRNYFFQMSTRAFANLCSFLFNRKWCSALCKETYFTLSNYRIPLTTGRNNKIHRVSRWRASARKLDGRCGDLQFTRKKICQVR